MRDTKNRLRALDRIDPPDVWHRAASMELSGEPELEPGPGPSGIPWQKRVAAGVVAFAVFGGVVALAVIASGRDDPTVGVGDSSTPTASVQAIEVTAPTSGDEVSPPVTVTGTAEVFEGTVTIWIVDQTGNRIANTFTTTTCGGGCRGEFSVDVPYSVGAAQAGTIWVFEESAEDGRRLHTVRIPVMLTPGTADPVADALEGQWTDEQGNPLPDGTSEADGYALVAHTLEGPDHCGWTSATFLHLGWPLGTVAHGSEHIRQYLRDPQGVLADVQSEPFELDARLPDDAAFSGFRRGAWQIWTAPSDIDEAIYLVNDDPAAHAVVERWPRTTELVACR
jgi:hypothetical protein